MVITCHRLYLTVQREQRRASPPPRRPESAVLRGVIARPQPFVRLGSLPRRPDAVLRSRLRWPKRRAAGDALGTDGSRCSGLHRPTRRGCPAAARPDRQGQRAPVRRTCRRWSPRGTSARPADLLPELRAPSRWARPCAPASVDRAHRSSVTGAAARCAKSVVTDERRAASLFASR
jgi:hypothetical protein